MEQTFNIQLVTDNNGLVSKQIVIAKLQDLTIANLRKRLDVPTNTSTVEYVMQYQSNARWKDLLTDSDLESLPNSVKVRLDKRKVLSKEEHRLLLLEKEKSEARIKEIQKSFDIEDQKRKQLRPEWLDRFDSGKITFNNEEQVWTYETTADAEGPCALLTSTEVVDGRPLVYRWDGTLFTPSNTSFGSGKWDGEKLSWYPKFQDVFSGSKQPRIAFCWREKGNKYKPLPDYRGGVAVSTWKWENDKMVSRKSRKSWQISGSVSPPVVMLLQLMRYHRKGKPSRSESTPKLPSQSSPTSPAIFPKEGLCLVKTGASRGWKKKWMVLLNHGTVLYYFNSQEDQRKNQIDSYLDLKGCVCSTAIKKEKYCVMIVPSAAPDMHQFLVDSRAERDSWIGALVSHGATKGAIRKEGFLKSRMRYWFVLQKETLQYYSERREAIQGKPPKGEIELVNCIVKETELLTGSYGRKPPKPGFALFQQSGKKYYLFAETTLEAQEW